MQLYEALAMHVAAWREENYRHEEYPAIAEILEWASDPDVPNFRLRKPQLRALETYWYLRLRERTPHIFDLHIKLFPKVTERLPSWRSSSHRPTMWLNCVRSSKPHWKKRARAID